MAAATLGSIDEYLQKCSFNPDVEYIDGELRERARGLLCAWTLAIADQLLLRQP